MTYLEAVAAGRAACESEEVLRRVERDDDQWVAVLGIGGLVSVDLPSMRVVDVHKTLVRRVVVGSL